VPSSLPNYAPNMEIGSMMDRFASNQGVHIRRAALMGFVAGLRSQVPLFLLSQAAGNGTFGVDAGPPLSWLRLPRVRLGLGLSAAGEMIVDKAPFVPNRTEPAPLIGRMATGAAAGAAIASDAGASAVEGAVAGGVGAVVGSFAGQYVRGALRHILGLPDFVVAVAEDGLALALGHRAVYGQKGPASPPVKASGVS